MSTKITEYKVDKSIHQRRVDVTIREESECVHPEKPDWNELRLEVWGDTVYLWFKQEYCETGYREELPYWFSRSALERVLNELNGPEMPKPRNRDEAPA